MMILLTSTCDCNRCMPVQTSVRFPAEEENMLYALCSNRRCHYSVELHDTERGRSIETPQKCPICKFEVISACPNCGFPFVGAPGSTICQVCGSYMKRSSVELQAGALESPSQ